MANGTTTMGTLLLLGVVFLSLNALAVSARPGEVSTAEKMTTATAVVLLASSSAGDAPTESPVAVLPTPALNPSLGTLGVGITPLPAPDPQTGPVASPGAGIQPPSSVVQPIQVISPGRGMYPPSFGVVPPVTPGNGVVQPGPAPVPLPVPPGPVKVLPVPTPPHAVDPINEGL